MNALRSGKNVQKYQEYLASLAPGDACQFCAITPGDEQFVSQTEHFKVIRNRFPYAVWDTRPVIEHLMIIPKQHIETLADLTAPESKEFVDQISAYEAAEYNIYARAPRSQMRSVKHQHTHLIKISNTEE